MEAVLLEDSWGREGQSNAPGSCISLGLEHLGQVCRVSPWLLLPLHTLQGHLSALSPRQPHRHPDLGLDNFLKGPKHTQVTEKQMHPKREGRPSHQPQDNWTTGLRDKGKGDGD